MDFTTMTVEELEARKSAIAGELDGEGADLDALEAEVKSINAELESRKAIEAKKNELRSAVASGAGEVVKPQIGEVKMNENEKRGQDLKEGKSVKIGIAETRSVLVSSGTLATPTGVSGINDMVGGGNTALLDLINVVNCEGMGANKVAYVAAETAEAATQTEGSAATSKEPTFDYVTITPTNIANTAQISKQAKKQSPLDYEAKVNALALKSLRKKACSLVAAAMKASTLNQVVTATLDASDKGVIGATTLRDIAFAYGGNDEIDGGATLFLNKADLIAFGDVRGTNEKLPVYEIIPDAAKPNTGIIKDGGLSVPYCIVSGLTACAGTSQSSSAAIPTMIYGSGKACELDLFSDYEIRVSEDFAITSLMDTIVGDVELGCDVVVKNGFVAYTIPKGT